MPDADPPAPHPLDLYRLAVQHPLAEVAFIERCWSHHHPADADAEPMLLREDFAGTCAVASAWCASDPDRQAMAIELDEPTARWAADRFDDPDLHILVDDVVNVDEPAVDVTVSLNFSTLVYHDRPALLRYLANARRGLNPGGLLVMDLFGGTNAQKPITQRRRVEPDEAGIEPFDYRWDQRGADPQTRRIDCRIHFTLDDGRRIEDAFIYDWRLWRPGELIGAALEAGFAEAALWWAPPGGPDPFEPVPGEPDESDWVGYVVCRAP
jgi:SAM-dependent methyltransferase